jgi:alpha-tubulin suppressor-like RCC1 family protein
VSKVACGKHHTVALTGTKWNHLTVTRYVEDGECYSFGGGMCGQLGHRNKQNQVLPKQVDTFHKKKIVDITCGYLHTLALTSDGKLFIWGYVSDDHLGLSEGEEYHSAPLAVNTDHVANQFVKITAGGWHNAALTSL